MTCYAEKRKGKLTGVWIAEASIEVQKGHRTRLRERFASKSAGDKWAASCELLGKRLPTTEGAGDDKPPILTFADVAGELKEAGGPEGTWARGKDKSVLQRLEAAMCSSLGKLPIVDVRYGVVEKFLIGLSKRPSGKGKGGDRISAHTLNRYLSAISSVLTYAERKEYIDRPPQLPWRKAPPRKRYGYAPEQEISVLGALRAAGRGVDALCFQILSVSGLRAGELFGLKPEQIDDEFINLDDPERIKNGETRSVYIGQQLARELRAIIATGSLPKYHAFYVAVREAIKSAGLEIPRPLHALRHTAATRTVEAHQDLQVAQQLLGHKNSRTTEGYRHISKEVLRARAKEVSLLAGLGGAKVVNLAEHTASQALEKAVEGEATSGIEPEYTVLQTDC